MFKTNFVKQMMRDITQKFKEKVETVYCIEHDQFARLVVVDEKNGQWRIEGCCLNLMDKAKAAISED